MEFEHRSVLLTPTVEALLPHGRDGQPRRSGVFVDGTFGRGGHSRELLARLDARARLVVFDKDPEAIAVARALAEADARVTVVHDGFATMPEALAALGVTQVDGVMLDLGVSSPQIDDAQRGFSFMRDGPLDMRMDTSRGLTAAQWLAEASVDEMREVIAGYGEERFAFQIAKALAARREVRPLHSTSELAELVAGVVRTREKGQHPATRTFQAIRIHINRELEELADALQAVVALLATCGRLAVISFHSLEDRMVKQSIAAAGQALDPALARLPLRASELPQPVMRPVARIKPDGVEVDANPRARSAVLRVAERTDAPWRAAAAPSLPLGGQRAIRERGKRR